MKRLQEYINEKLTIDVPDWKKLYKKLSKEEKKEINKMMHDENGGWLHYKDIKQNFINGPMSQYIDDYYNKVLNWLPKTNKEKYINGICNLYEIPLYSDDYKADFIGHIYSCLSINRGCDEIDLED